MKNIIYIFFTISLLFLSSCNKDFLDINQNPNQPVTSNPSLVLPSALNNTASEMINRNEIGSFWAGQWSPSGSVSGFQGEKTYNINSGFRTGIWDGIYDNLNDYHYIDVESVKLSWKAYSGIAKTMKVFLYQAIVDAYGNIPYTESLKGTEAIRPKYDDASAIYEDFIKKLNEAIADLKVPISGSNPSPAGSDIYFTGNTSSWIRFANTLKLRILLRQSNIPSRDSFIKSEIAKIIADNTRFLGADENVESNPSYIKSNGKQNQFWETYGFTAAGTLAGGHDFYGYSNFFITFLQNTNDPRLGLLASKATLAPYTGQFRGVPFGDGNDDYLYAKISGFGPAILKSYDQPMVIMTAAESFFLQSEAVFRGYMSGNAKNLFESGITESFKLVDLTAADAKSFYDTSVNPSVNWNAATNKLETIITQKWVALASFNGYEAWCEFRRTGFPRVPLSTRAQTPKHPMRLLYPLSEVAANADNVKAQGEINQFDTKIFWIK